MKRFNEDPMPSTSREHVIQPLNQHTYPSSGLRLTQHGVAYQLKLIILFLQRGIKCGHDFLLAAEMDSAEKFDDLVFRKKNEDGTYFYLFLQAKHKLDDSKVISWKDLKGLEGDFSLKKYFNSFCKIKRNSEFADGCIQRFVLATNINFNFDELNDKKIDLYRKERCNEFNEFLEINQSIPYEISLANSEFSEDFKYPYDFEALAKELMKCLKDKNHKLTLQNEILKSYHEALVVEDVIKIEVQGKKKTARFHDDFINNATSLSEEARALRNYICSHGSSISSDVNISISSTFGKRADIKSPRLSLPSDCVEENVAEAFFENLTFLVNTPNEVDLGNLLRNEIGDEFNLKNSDLVASEILKEMFDWFKRKGREEGREGTFFSSNDGKELLENIKQKVEQLVLVGCTQDYISNIKSFNIFFNGAVVEKFKVLVNRKCLLNQNSHILKMTTANTTLTAIKIWQVLDATKLYEKQDSYIFISVATLMSLKDRVSCTFKSKSSNLLIIEFKVDERHRDLNDILKFILTKLISGSLNKKIILIVTKNSQEDYTLESNYETICESTYDNNDDSFSKFTPESKSSIKETMKIELQQKSFSATDVLDDTELQSLTPNELLDIITKKLIKIGHEIPKHSGYVENCYIPRLFDRYVEFDKQFLSDLDLENDLFALRIGREFFNSSFIQRFRLFQDDDPNPSNPIKFIILDDSDVENQFQSLCRKYPKYNIHLLEYDERFIWKRSHNSVSHIIRCSSQRNPSRDIKVPELSEIDLCSNIEKILLISSKPGMGKSTVLTNLAKIIQQSYQNPIWIVRVDLNHYTKTLKASLNNQTTLNTLDEAVPFLIEKLMLLKLETNLERKLLKDSLTKESSKIKTVLIFDGFDEISPNYQELVINLIKIFTKSFVYKVMITTRPIMREYIEEELGVFAYNLKYLSKNDQIDFLTKHWSQRINFNESINLVKYAETLVTEFNDTIKEHEKLDVDLYSKTWDDVSKFTGIPLNIKLLADWQVKFLLDANEKNEIPEPPLKFELLDLYEHFVNEMFYSHYEYKQAIDRSKVGNEEDMQDSLYKTFIRNYTLLAVDSLLSIDNTIIRFFLLTNEDESKVIKLKNEIIKQNKGIVEHVIDGKPIFIHLTFVDYFAAFAFAEQINSKDNFLTIIEYINQSTNTSSIFTLNIVKQLKIRKTFENFTEEELCEFLLHIYEQTRSTYANRYHPLRPFLEELLLRVPHSVANFSENYTFPRLLSYFFAHGRLDVIKTVFDGFDDEKKKRLCNAKDNGKTPMLRLDETYKLKDNDFLEMAKYLIKNQGTYATDDMTCDAVEAKENVNSHIKLGLEVAIQRGYMKSFEYFYEQSKLKNILEPRIVFFAAQVDQLEILKILLKRGSGNIHCTSHSNQSERLTYLLKSAFHSASSIRNVEKMIKILEDIKERYKIDMKTLVNYRNGPKSLQPFLHCAAKSRNKAKLKFLLQNGADINALNIRGWTALHQAIKDNNFRVVKLLVENGGNVNISYSKNQTALHLAFSNCSNDLLKFLIQIKGINLNGKDRNGNTVLHKAVKKKSCELVKLLVKYGADVNIVNNLGVLPSELAVKNNCSEEILSLLT